MDNVTGFGEGGRGSIGITGGRRVVRVGLELPSSSDCHNSQLYDSLHTHDRVHDGNITKVERKDMVEV